MALAKQKVKLADELGITPEDVDRAVAETDTFADGTYASVEVEIDFDAGPSPCPDGTYHARLEAVEKKTAQSSGNDMAVWRFRTIKDKQAFWLNTVLTKDAMWKVSETAVACGAKGDGRIKIGLETLIGNLCRLVIKNETYEGAQRPTIKKVIAPTQETYDLSDLAG